MARVLVTGANGHVGANTVRSLLARGHEVMPVVRQNADVRSLAGLGLAYRYADVMDAEAVRAAAEGCDVIVHTAAVYRTWAKDPEDIVAPSIVGARNIYAAAKAVGAKRVVYTSSVAAVGLSASPDQVRTAAHWNEDARNPYFVAKVRGEQEAIRLSEETGIATIRLCPTYVLGPWDYRITPSTKSLVLGLIDGSGITWKGGVNIVHVADVGEAHARAVDQGEPGGRYIVAGENIEVRQAGALVERLTGVQPRHLAMGRGAAMAAGAVLDLLGKLTGKEPQFTRSLAYQVVERYSYYDAEETGRALGLVPKGAEEALRDSIRWLLALGLISGRLSPEAAAALAPEPEWVQAV